MGFCDKLKALRTEHNLTQEEFAKNTGLSRSAVGMYESGKREPNFETLEVIADYFNVDMNTLLDTPIQSIDLDEHERKHLELYRMLDKAGRKVVDDVTVTYAEKARDTETSSGLTDIENRA